jgi:hypothetical protein
MSTETIVKDRNTRRRERYATDPAYRERILLHERSKRSSEPFDCRTNLTGLQAIGAFRAYDEVVVKGEIKGKAGITFTIDEAAKALGRTPKSLYKYFSKSLFPRPPHKVKGPSGLEQEAYTEDEMIRLIHVFGQHQAETPYYGVYHTDTTKALFEALGYQKV